MRLKAGFAIFFLTIKVCLFNHKLGAFAQFLSLIIEVLAKKKWTQYPLFYFTVGFYTLAAAATSAA